MGSSSPSLPTEWIKYGVVGMCGYIVLAWIFPGFFYLFLLTISGVGGLFWYLHQTCPSDDSFDAKRELKRVLRGHHLADNDPNKPKGFFRKRMARLGATLQTEIHTAMGQQHATTISPIATIAKVARIRVQQSNREYTWIGIANRWIFYRCNDISEEHCELTDQTGGRGIVT